MWKNRSAMFEGVTDDLWFSLRMLRHHRVYACVSLLTLALGIGATTAVFAVIDATLLRPLPYRNPSRLVALSAVGTDPDRRQTAYSPSQIELIGWRAAARSFEAVEGVEPRALALTGEGEPEVLAGGAVSSGLFHLLGVEPGLGRTFTAEEEGTDARRAVISDRLWRRRFNADPSALGRVIRLDGQPFDIVGVMPAGFQPLLISSDVWVPLHAMADPARQGLRIMSVAGRLRSDVTIADARQELSGISARLATEFPTSHGRMKPQVIDLQENIFGQARPALAALGAGVTLLLLLACVNLLNLTLGHASSRRGELVMRAVLGASRWRLARLQVVQTLLLATAGALLGVAIMNRGLPVLVTLATYNGQPPPDVSIDWRVAAFAGVVTLGTALLGGAVPALRTHGACLDGGMTHVATSRVAGSRWERRVRGALVVVQVALAVTLLCGAGTFVASLQRVLTTAPGFSPANVLSMQMTLPPARYPDVAARAAFVRQMLDRVSSVPGVVAVGTTQTTFLPNQSMQTLLFIEGRPVDAEHAESAHIRHITPGYFRALQAGVIEGRAFDARDQMGTTPACIVSARFARQFWPNQSAIGRRIRRISANAPWMTVVGVAADVMDAGLGVQQGPTLYVDYLQLNTATARVSLVVRTTGDSLPVAGAVRHAIWAIDPGQAVDRVERLSDVLVESTGDQQFRTALLSLFALVGLALALVGVYGVAAAAVKARTWEVGVRLALGATPLRVVLDMLGEASRRVALGAIGGLVVFLALGRLVAGLLYNTSPAEPIVLAAAVLPLSLVSMIVSYWQARRLSRVPPVLALRNDVER